MRNILAAAALLVFSSGGIAQGFKSVTLSEAFLPAHASPNQRDTIALKFTVPDNYVKRDFPDAGVVIWGTEEDIEQVRKSSSFAKTKNGTFTLKISTNVGYDAATKKFSNEDGLRGDQRLSGLSDLTFEKSEVNGFPMATLTAASGGRRLFLHYIALGTGTLLINYFHAENFSSDDSDKWRRLLAGFKEKP
jgi:hypothetical protein